MNTRFSKTILFFFSLIVLALLFSCDSEPSELSCTDAGELTDEAYNDFLNSDFNNFQANCLAYQEALQQQLSLCPDNADEITNLLNDLGSCEFGSFFKVDFDNETYLATTAAAHIADGKLTITAERGTESFEIVLHQTLEGTYELGTTDTNANINSATYYSDITSGETWISVSDGMQSMGEITISEIDYNNLTLTGVFNFTGVSNGATKGFTNGIFINLPLTKEDDFFALVDGVEFIDEQILPYVNEDSQWVGFVILNGDNSANMDFTFDETISPGSYSFSMLPNLPRAGYTGNPDYYYHARGSITITAHNTLKGFIMGTFEFIGEFENGTPESYMITEGRFCLNYP